MKVLVTGGCGFLGRHVMKLLGDKAASLDNLDPVCGGNGDGIKVNINSDITQPHTLNEVVRSFGFTHIIHLAAYGRNLSCRDFPVRAWSVNRDGTFNVLSVALSNRALVERVIVCSSNIVLSDQPTHYKESKLAAERLVQKFSEAGVSCMGLRPSNIYGAGQSKTEYQPCAFASLDESYKTKGYFEISGDGTQTRDWVHVEDVARAFVAALDSKISGQTLDICTGRQISMNDVAKLLGAPVAYVSPRPGDAKALVSNPEPAGTSLGFWSEIKLEERLLDAFPSVPCRVK